jgi:uncharacterized membrane protein YhaH (DUF805 family)
MAREMTSMKSVLDNWISRDGRLSQRGYVLAFMLPFTATAAVTWASLAGKAGELSAPLLQMCSVAWVLLLAVGDALNIRRYHDLGHSGRLYRLCRPGLVVLPLLAFILHFFIPTQMASAGDLGALAYLIGLQFDPSIGPVPLALLVLTFAGVGLNVAYLSLMPGQTGPNAHGPDPRDAAALPDPGAMSGTADAGDDDPVKRALAEYQSGLAKSKTAPVASPARPAVSFGKRR